MLNKKIFLIFNPVSGGGKKHQLQEAISHFLSGKGYSFHLATTLYAGHGKVLAREAIDAGYEIVVAVGGDGTVNEVASELVASPAALGILPVGSGNGLARHLGLPLHPMKALKKLIAGSSFAIDVCYMNERPFFCTAGLGFDAAVSHKFDHLPGRGFWNYAKASFQIYNSFTPVPLRFEVNTLKKETSCFLFTVANANQFGNNAYIAPQADITDGLMDVVMLKQAPWWMLPQLGWKLFAGSISGAKGVENLRTNQVVIDNNQVLRIHLDGEPLEVSGRIVFKIGDGKLRVLH